MRKTTAEKILDAAEQLFAQNGYDATSLGDVADIVGIRGPGIYKHFKNKQSLFEQVLARRFDPILEMVNEGLPGNEDADFFDRDLIRNIFRYHVHNPNLARLIQHTTLAGGEQLDMMATRWCEPIMRGGAKRIKALESVIIENRTSVTALLMAYCNIILAYVTLGPLYNRAFDIDVFAEPHMDAQIDLIIKAFQNLPLSAPH